MSPYCAVQLAIFFANTNTYLSKHVSTFFKFEVKKPCILWVYWVIYLRNHLLLQTSSDLVKRSFPIACKFIFCIYHYVLLMKGWDTLYLLCPRLLRLGQMCKFWIQSFKTVTIHWASIALTRSSFSRIFALYVDGNGLPSIQ